MADEQMKAYYRLRAPEYEQIYYRDNAERRREIDDEAAFLREFADGKEVLDLACGTGYWTQILAERASMVVAADIAPEMLEEARRKMYAREPEFVLGDLEHPPFGEAGFDLVVLGFWLSHQPRETYPGFFATLKRVIRPGGSIWMIDNNPPAEGPTVESSGVDGEGNNYKHRFLGSGERFEILKNYFGAEELGQIGRKYGEIERLVHKRYYWSILLCNR